MFACRLFSSYWCYFNKRQGTTSLYVCQGGRLAGGNDACYKQWSPQCHAPPCSDPHFQALAAALPITIPRFLCCWCCFHSSQPISPLPQLIANPLPPTHPPSHCFPRGRERQRWGGGGSKTARHVAAVDLCCSSEEKKSDRAHASAGYKRHKRREDICTDHECV